MGGIIRYESLVASALWHSASPKKAPDVRFGDIFTIEKEWCWSGTHYQRTANDWLANFDAYRDAIEASLRKVFGEETGPWMRRWRWFFLATSGLFGYADGTEWSVSQYRLKATE